MKTYKIYHKGNFMIRVSHTSAEAARWYAAIWLRLGSERDLDAVLDN